MSQAIPFLLVFFYGLAETADAAHVESFASQRLVTAVCCFIWAAIATFHSSCLRDSFRSLSVLPASLSRCLNSNSACSSAPRLCLRWVEASFLSELKHLWAAAIIALVCALYC